MRALIFGAGRLGSNFAAYASHLGHEASLVGRLTPESDIRAAIERADLIAAAIPDGVIADWRKRWRGELKEKTAVHFSGALIVDGMRSYHPLYSFPKTLIGPQAWRAIAIIREEGAPEFSSLLPGAANPEFVIRAADRPYYHAIAVLTGNFAAHIWNEAAASFAARLGVPPETLLGPYLEGVVERFRESPNDSMTGPLARRDPCTIAANLAALEGEPRLKALYEAFLASAWPDRPREPGKP